MKRYMAMSALVLLAGMLVGAPASAKEKYHKVKGQVIKVEQHVRTANGGEYDRLTIRTWSGERLHLNLGPGGACDGCLRAGDQIRARVQSTDGPGEARRTQSMRVRRDGQMFGFTNANGTMVRSWSRSQTGVGIRDRDRDRLHQPGTSGCLGCNSGSRGGAGQGSAGGGGGRSGGGGGG